MMTSWASNASVSPWGDQQSAQQQQWAATQPQYPMAPPVSQYNQFNFASNTPYDRFSGTQRSLPSPNMNHQFLGLNGNPTTPGMHKVLDLAK